MSGSGPERFWTYYLIGRFGLLHTLGTALLGFLRVAGAILVVLGTALFVAKAFPETFAFLVASCLVMWVMWQLLRSIFR